MNARTICTTQGRDALRMVLTIWLVFGSLAVLTLPSARAMHGLIGWMPFWLVGVPAMMAWSARRYRTPIVQQARRISR
jgi:hypothetical protein